MVIGVGPPGAVVELPALVREVPGSIPGRNYYLRLFGIWTPASLRIVCICNMYVYSSHVYKRIVNKRNCK
jgi:hypothetical protein